MVVWSTSSSDLGEPFEDTDHALSVLGQECSRLLDHLFVVESSHEDGRDNDSKNGEEKIVVFPQSIGVVDICDCQM